MPTEIILAPNCVADMPAALESYPGHRQVDYSCQQADGQLLQLLSGIPIILCTTWGRCETGCNIFWTVKT
jgi:hypothetical protein